MEERHESTDTDEEEAAEELQGSKEEGAVEEPHDSNDTEATWHSCQREYLNLSLSLARILEEAAEEQDDSTEDSNDDSECRIDTDYTADESARHQAASSAHDTAERHAHLSHLDPETHLQTLETLRQASGKRLLSAALLASAMGRRQSSVPTSHRPPDCATRAPSGTSFFSGGGVRGGGGKSEGEEAGRGRGGSNASASESHAHTAHGAAAAAAATPSPRPSFTPTSSPRAKQQELCYMRVDAADGKAYPLESFLEVYGEDEGQVRWAAAASAQTPTAAADGEGELLKALPVRPTGSERECTPERSKDENGAVQRLQQAALQQAVLLLPQDRPPIALASCTPAHPRMVLRSSKYSGSAGVGGGGMRGIELSARHNTSCNRAATELQQSCSSVGGMQGIELSARPGHQVVAKKAASSSITSPPAASPRTRSDATPTSNRPPTTPTTSHTPPTSDTPPASKWKQYTPVNTPMTVLYSHTPPTNDTPPTSHTPPQASGGGVSRSEGGGGWPYHSRQYPRHNAH